MKKIIGFIGLLVVGFVFYNNFNYPNMEKIENSLTAKTELEANQINWKETYKDDVVHDLENKSISTSNIAFAEMYSNQFLPPKNIEKQDAQKLAKILNDSASYLWGETTVEFNRFLLFFDNDGKVIALTKIDEENEYVKTVPFTRTMKWGRLSKKGFNDFYSVINDY